jgi:predicted secreted hydrolase
VNRTRRRLLAALPFTAWGDARAQSFPSILPGMAVELPRDHGSHPGYRTEWWYVTGWMRDDDGDERGVQVTFFRSRPGLGESSASAFAPRQLLFAHAAIADARTGRLVHAERAARVGFGLAAASEATTDVRLDGWTLKRDGDVYRAKVEASAFALDLAFAVTRPPVLQGERGISRKGPRADQASGYYSIPQLALDGTVDAGGRAQRVRGVAWLDHEWSSAYMAPEAAGWDWTGLNLDDGGALMAFRMRGRSGGVVWAGGSLRDAGGRLRTFSPAEVAFSPGRTWRSPRTGIAYPVTFSLRAGDLEVDLAPLMDDQELDASGSVGIVYWEGAVRARVGGRPAGRGYLELTGYGRPISL